MKLLLAGIVSSVLLSTALASAQTTELAPDPDITQIAAQNQLGVLEYCHAQGHLDDAPLDIQKKMISFLPTPTNAAAVEAAYETGKKGTFSIMGAETTLADAAKTNNMDVATICGHMGKALEQAAGQFPQ